MAMTSFRSYLSAQVIHLFYGLNEYILSLELTIMKLNYNLIIWKSNFLSKYKFGLVRIQLFICIGNIYP